MRYEIITTGKGMLPPGVIVGDVKEADSLEENCFDYRGKP